MPELPEVETVCRGIRQGLAAQPQIQKVEVRRRDLRVPIPIHLAEHLTGQKIIEIRRRAKYLLFDTAKSTIISHLGMSGSWRFAEGNETLKHDHCDIIFASGQRLVFHDPRRFGLIECVARGKENQSKWLRHLGVEPLSESLTADYLKFQAKNRLIPVKSFIMNQEIVVGVGNIYASEALFQANIRPTRKVSKLQMHEWSALQQAIQTVLTRAIQQGGTTLRDYRQTSGAKGLFQQELFVYDRNGYSCKICRSQIFSRMIAGRSTYWCGKCQK